MTRRTFGAASVCSGMNVSGRLGDAGGGRKSAQSSFSLPTSCLLCCLEHHITQQRAHKFYGTVSPSSAESSCRPVTTVTGSQARKLHNRDRWDGWVTKSVSIFTTACMEVGTIGLLTAACLVLYSRQFRATAVAALIEPIRTIPKIV